jgi:predicted nucleotidyltransferase
LLITHLPGQIERLILFGSHARGEARPDSDVDVLVVVNWPQERLPNGFYAAFTGDPRWREIINLATDLMLKYGIFISPTVVSKDRLGGPSPLIWQAEREGIEVWRKSPS